MRQSLANKLISGRWKNACAFINIEIQNTDDDDASPNIHEPIWDGQIDAK